MGKYIKKIKVPRVYKCSFCGADFNPKKKSIKFCSLRCFHDHRKQKRVSKICKHCGKTFQLQPCHERKGEGSFCSNKCRRASFIGPGHPTWKGGVKRKRERDAAWVANKVKTDPAFRINRVISSTVRRGLSLGKQYKSWREILPYTVHELMAHLEKMFQPGMTWDNYGDWHIDHIIPVSVFSFKTTKDIDFKKCWSLSNLRPLWAKDNIRKGNRLEKPFQPSLSISL